MSRLDPESSQYTEGLTVYPEYFTKLLKLFAAENLKKTSCSTKISVFAAYQPGHFSAFYSPSTSGLSSNDILSRWTKQLDIFSRSEDSIDNYNITTPGPIRCTDSCCITGWKGVGLVYKVSLYCRYAATFAGE